MASRAGSKARLYAVGFGVIFTDMVGYGIISPSIPLFAKTLAATDAQMGYAFAGYPIAFTLTVLPLGFLVDRVGKNRLIICAAMVWLAIASLMMAYAASIGMLIAARALQGFASAAAWVAVQPLIARASGVDEVHSQQMSVITIAAGLGVIVGPLLGGIGDLATPFVINAGLAAVLGVMGALLLPAEGTPTSENKLIVAELLRRRGILVACLAIFSSCACFGIMELLLPLHLDRLGYLKLSIGAFFGVFSVAYVVSQPLISRWIEKRGGYEPMCVGSLGLAVMMAVVIQATSVVGLSVALAILGAFSGTLFLASMLIVGENSREGQRGSAFALWNLAFSLGYLVGPTVGGNLSNTFGLETAFYVFAGFLLFATAWMFARR